MWLEPIVKDCVSSTNSYIKENRLPCGSVVVARRQSAGRGRRGRSCKLGFYLIYPVHILLISLYFILVV